MVKTPRSQAAVNSSFAAAPSPLRLLLQTHALDDREVTIRYSRVCRPPRARPGLGT
jgi:hypothetical protein